MNKESHKKGSTTLSTSRENPTMIPRAVCKILVESGGKGMGILC